jgi:Leucine-rich repeat (LRR) protein
MTDKEIIEILERKINKKIETIFINDNCVSLSLNNDQSPFNGVIRHFPSYEKQNILNIISDLKHLKFLDLRKNLLCTFPASFGDLINLEHLNLGSNNLNEIPSFVFKNKKLIF